MVTKFTASFQEIQFSDADIVNIDDFVPSEEFNSHNVHPILIHDAGFVVLGVVFAAHLQDALDIMVDNHKLDSFLIQEASNTPGTTGINASDYPTLGTEEEEGITRLGNASEPFDIETLGALDMPNPKMSFIALFKAMQETEEEK